MAKKLSPGYDVIGSWMKAQSWKAFDFQKESWAAFLEGRSGLLNAPTGYGKTFALFLPVADRVDRSKS